MTIEETTEQTIAQWRLKRWPKPGDDHWITRDMWDAAKVAEEAGELCGAVTKMAEGRADTFKLRDEMGDVLIALSVMAGNLGWTVDEVRAARWEEVKDR